MLPFYSKVNTAYFAYGKKKVPLWWIKDWLEHNTYLHQLWRRELKQDLKHYSIFTVFDEFAPISDDVIVRLENAQNH